MNFFKRYSASGHEISRKTADNFLINNKNNFVDPKKYSGSNEYKIKQNEIHQKLKDKIIRFDEIVNNSDDIDIKEILEMKYLVSIYRSNFKYDSLHDLEDFLNKLTEFLEKYDKQNF